MLKENFHVAVPTAFFEDESLDIKGTMAHIRNLKGQGVKSVLVSGTTGEQHSLNLQEKLEMVEALESEGTLVDDMEIIFGVASIRQKEAEQLAKAVGETKIAGVMLGYPPYIRPSQAEALTYSKRIIELAGKPVILYNNHGRTGFDLSAESIIELARQDAVIGIKDAGDRKKIEQVQEDVNGAKLYFYAGGEEDLREKTAYGYDRLSSIAGNVAPLEIRNWFESLRTGEDAGAGEEDRVKEIMAQVYRGNAVVNLKRLLNQADASMGRCRAPIGNAEG
ncbi:dihydrodipicolinate synthase family protein [Salinicoccus roseus]|uniref:dihydrodipicolinate synthase family protein n=1 Tax=Salinicoccus roseus TaxID=45670 RepID=UPI002301BDE2|nr:dihydrodipicolinate synthase family protein [Salinicoccus roseus]